MRHHDETIGHRGELCAHVLLEALSRTGVAGAKAIELQQEPDQDDSGCDRAAAGEDPGRAYAPVSRQFRLTVSCPDHLTPRIQRPTSLPLWRGPKAMAGSCPRKHLL